MSGFTKKEAASVLKRFMEMALYEPGLGYYSAGATRFGAAGDFITAPHVSPLFFPLPGQAMPAGAGGPDRGRHPGNWARGRG